MSPAKRVGPEVYFFYKIQLIFEVSLLSRDISVVLEFPMNSKSSTINIYHASTLHQSNNNDDTDSVLQIDDPFLAVVLPLTTINLQRLPLQPCSSVHETIVLNFATKAFPQLPTKNSSVWFHCNLTMTFLPFTTVKLSLFSSPMLHKLFFISLMTSIKSFHAIGNSR